MTANHSRLIALISAILVAAVLRLVPHPPNFTPIGAMDPAYSVVVNGQLVNSLPSTPQQDADSRAGRFGQVCFLGDDCGTITGTSYPANTGQYLLTAGGPGTTNFVPNNVEPVNTNSASSFRQARYYDVTLRQAGTTTLSASATIDALTVNGSLDTRLNIASTGNLRVWSDFNQLGGWTNVDGRLTTGEALVASGILSGSGVFDPTYLTVVGGAVAPGGGGIGTLTISGNVIMRSSIDGVG